MKQTERTPPDAGNGPRLAWGGIAAPLLLATAFLVVVSLAVRHSEIITGRRITSGVPPILAVAGLMLAVGAPVLLRRLKIYRQLSGAQALVLYAMLTIGVWVGGAYGLRAFLPHLVSLQYWGQSQPALAPYAEHLPPWYAPRGAELARIYFEGSREGIVPWGEWIPVLLRWTPFFLALFTAPLCLMLLMRRQWLEAERLSFPLLALPLALATDGGRRYAGGRPLFRHPLLWVGFGVAAGFNALNIGRALIPTIPAPGFYYSLAGLFPERPWTPLNSISLYFMLETIGFGYLVPLDISFSAWFLYLVEKLVAVGGMAAGLDQPGYPFIQDQCAGAYLACGLVLVWGARRHLAETWRRAKKRCGEERFAWVGLAVSSAVLVGWAWAAGLVWQIALPFFAVLGCFVLVYARMRAETGVPMEWIYPYGLPKEMLVNAVTVPAILSAGGVRSMVIFSSLAWLSRHHLAEALAAYQVDGLKLAEQERVNRAPMMTALLVAFVVGMAGSVWVHLSAYYQIGSNASIGGAGEGRARVALQEYQRMASQIAA
ncbi:MAG: hypothetical protein QHJ73_16075, partial [Armatimonadota bacterium]|nr:hypothetical protein [Armatimonadota bacterium]